MASHTETHHSTVHNVHDAKTNLSKLLELAASGEVVVIAKAGKPLAKLVAYEKPKGKRIGFLAGYTFDAAASAAMDSEIEALFHGEDADKKHPEDAA